MKNLILVLAMLLISDCAFADHESAAKRKALQATVKHFEIDKMARKLEKKYIPKDVRIIGGNIFLVADVIIKQRIVVKWTF